MSTTHAVRPGVSTRSSSSSSFSGTGFLLGFMLRRDAVRLVVTTAALLAFCTYYVTATAALYPTFEARQARAASISNAGGVFLSGPGYGLQDYTPGAMFVNEMVLWVIVFLAMLNILQITRNTRAEEETGRAELVHALPVGRHAAPVAALVEVVLADVVFGVLGSVLLVTVGGLAAVDTVVLMAGIVLTALVFAAVATVTCQITVYGRGASGIAFAAVAAAVCTRGVGDIQEQHGSWLSWLSPIDWPQQLRAYVDLRFWPLGLSVLAIVVALAIAAVLAARRDLGGGLLDASAGRATAKPSLSSPFALAFRLQRTGLVWWLVGCVAMFGLSGAFLGRGAGELADTLAKQNELTATIFGSDPLGMFLRIFMLHCALAVAGFSTSAVLRVKSEEDEGRQGLELSRSVSRTNLLLSHVAVVIIAMLLLVFVGGAVALWAGSVSAAGDFSLTVLLTCAGTFAPAIAVVIAFAAACYAWVPSWATALSWAMFGVVVVESFFGPLLGLPDAVRRISPFWWVGNYPVTPVEPANMVGLCVAAIVLLGLAVVGFRRRDLTAG